MPLMVLVLLVSFSGCAATANPALVTSSNQTGQSAESPGAVSESCMVETKNEFDYQPGLECSAFASAYLLRHFGETAWRYMKTFPESLDYLANSKDEYLPYNRKTPIDKVERLWTNIDARWGKPYFVIEQ